VVVASADPGRLAEARRVATHAVLRVDSERPQRAEVEWRADDPRLGWGNDACVTLIAEDTSSWSTTLTAFAETLTDGYAGELGVVADSQELITVSRKAAEDGVSVRLIEAPASATLAERALAAAEATDRRTHVFVTRPAVPLPNWLPSILALFANDRDAGVVGTRILSFSGALEEAGGILGPDGSRQARGAGDENPDRPEYRFVRRVDFCSPPMLATRRDIFDRLDGFDENRLTAADALIDFSMRAGQLGAAVYYQPRASIVRIGEESQ
jgi:hypothetical protein